MKKILTVTMFFISSSMIGRAQIITIIDDDFAAFLRAKYPTCMNGNLLLPNCPPVTNERKLDCSNLNITYFDAAPLFLNLDSLICSENTITYFPALPPNLTYLDCSHNQLSFLPSLPSSLTSINCSYNKLKSLPELPAELKLFLANNNPELNCMPVLNKFNGTSNDFSIDSTGIACLPNLIQHPGTIEAIDTMKLCAGISPRGKICLTPFQSPVTLTSSASDTYQWTKDGNDIPGATNSTYGAYPDGVYSVKVTVPGCGVVSAPADTVGMLTFPKASVLFSSATTICGGTEVIFTASPENAGANPSYLWRVNKTDIEINSPEYATDSLSNGDTVKCIVTSDNVCAVNTSWQTNPFGQSSVIFTVYAAGDILGNDTTCNQGYVVLSPTGYGTSYQWMFSSDGVSFSNIVGATNKDYEFTSDVEGSTYYKMYIGDCTDTSEVFKQITVPTPVADFSFTNSGIQSNFNSGTSSGDILEYYWSFGDDSVSAEPNPVHVYSQEGIYNVCLTTLSEYCSSFICKPDTVFITTNTKQFSNEIEKGISLYPNPINSFTVTTNTEIKEAQLEVFNLIGEKVYSQFMNKKQETIDCNLSAGIYFVKVTEGKKWHTQKLIIQ